VVLNCWVTETNDTLYVSKVSLFGQGIADYNPLNKNRRESLEELRTGDGRSVPARLKAEILREIDRLELVLLQISEVEAERDEIIGQVVLVIRFLNKDPCSSDHLLRRNLQDLAHQRPDGTSCPYYKKTIYSAGRVG
jgi:hypothetical protein